MKTTEYQGVNTVIETFYILFLSRFLNKMTNGIKMFTCISCGMQSTIHFHYIPPVIIIIAGLFSLFMVNDLLINFKLVKIQQNWHFYIVSNFLSTLREVILTDVKSAIDCSYKERNYITKRDFYLCFEKVLLFSNVRLQS